MRISCIIPCYNAERFLGEAIESILAQTLLPAEIVVVDDGSTDGSAAVAAQFAGRVSYLRQENAGPAAARNAGLDATRGDFVAFLDADDCWHPQKLQRQAERFAESPRIDSCVTHLTPVWEDEVRHEQAALQGHVRTADSVPGYVMQTLLARRSAFERAGKLDSALRFGEDTEWFSRARDLGVVLELLPDALVYRRFHAHNLTRIRGNAKLKSSLLDIVQGSLERRRHAAAGAHSGTEGK
jgi:glycosyltransferase involved in cell wall biosynthesis